MSAFTGAALLAGIGVLGLVLMVTLRRLTQWREARYCGAVNEDKGIRCEKAPGHIKTPGGYHAARFMGGVFYWGDKLEEVA